MFVLSTVGVDVNVSGMGSPTSIGGNVAQTWTTSPNDPWQAGVNFGGSSSRTAEERYTDFENIQSNIYTLTIQPKLLRQLLEIRKSLLIKRFF
jgi:hypothetical protein